MVGSQAGEERVKGPGRGPGGMAGPSSTCTWGST